MPSIGVRNHPERDKIDKMILDGKPDRLIGEAVIPRLSRDCILRYRKTVCAQAVRPAAHVAKVLQDVGLIREDASNAELTAAVAKSAEGLAAASPFLARLAEFDFAEHTGISQAIGNTKPSEIAQMLNAITKRVELAASLCGVLSTPGGATVQVDARSLTVVVPNGKR